jgi:HAE1 family hydrophobic/amphiphilic exporter-1
VFLFFFGAAITVIALFIARNLQFGEYREGRYAAFSVRFEYYGMDAGELERLITIPLEEGCGILAGLREIRSTAEYGKSTTTLFFDREIDNKYTFLALRNVVDTLYNTLPGSVQKPRIYSSAADSPGILSLALTGAESPDRIRNYAENDLKKRIESLDGVSEVIVTGGRIPEIRVEFDPEKTAFIGLSPPGIGTLVQDANIISPGGRRTDQTRPEAPTETLHFNTRLRDLNQIEGLPVKTGETVGALANFIQVRTAPRSPDEIVRLNGRECVGLLVKAASGANIIKISRECRALLAGENLDPETVRILSDKGEYLRGLIKNVVLGVAESYLAISFLIPFFFPSLKVLLLILILIPVNSVWALAGLKLLGFGLDQNVLAGLSLSFGLVVDSSFVVAGLAENSRGIKTFALEVKALRPPLIASAATTVLALIPLFFLDELVPGIKNISLTIALMIAFSLVLACFFLPAFLPTPRQNPNPAKRPSGGSQIRAFRKLFSKIFRRVKRFYLRLSLRCCLAGLKRPRIVIPVYFGLGVLMFVLFFILGKNINLEIQEPEIFASVEMEPEISGEAIDRALASLTAALSGEPGIRYLKAESRKGSAELILGFDEKALSREALARRLVEYGDLIPGGFIYVPDQEGRTPEGEGFFARLLKPKPRVEEIQIAAVGMDGEECRRLAFEGAAVLNNLPQTIQTVLNFKNPEQTVYFYPDGDRIAAAGSSLYEIASGLRWLLFGPVVDKWLDSAGERDIRVAGKDLQEADLSRLSNLSLPLAQGSMRLEALGRLETDSGISKIYRLDGRRAAYFTVHLLSPSTSQAIQIVRGALASVEVQQGYGFLLSREHQFLSRQYRRLLTVFLITVAGILLLLTALTEDFFKSLLITSIIPVSCAFPLLGKFLQAAPLEMGDIVGMVIIGGISVNNGIFLTESRRSRPLFRLREKIPSLLAASSTTMAAAIPLILSGRQDFSGTLAASLLWGTAGSLVAAVFCFPCLLNCFFPGAPKKS